nr:MAG TPA: DNA ligase [Caudoviricetes sp.]
MKNGVDELYEKLTEMYENLNDDNVLNKAVSFLGSGDFQSLKLKIFKKIDNIVDDETINLIGIILKLANSIYNNTSYGTGITDSEYDILLSHYNKITGKEIITEPLLVNEDTSNHKYISLRGTIDKIYKVTDEDVLKNKSQDTIEDWINRTQNRYKDITSKDINLLEEEVYLMPKFDGVSCIFECNGNGEVIKALTRGDTERNIAQDLTSMFRDKIISHNCDVEHGLKTEIMMTDENFEEYNKNHNTSFKNTRSIVSSILNSKNPNKEDIEYLTIVPLRYSYIENGEESLQFIPKESLEYPHMTCKLKEFEKIHEFAFSHKTVYPGLRCDGCVIILTNPELQKILGRKDDKNKYEVAFKYTEEIAYSKVKNIEFPTGLFGRLNPVVEFKEVTMKGNTITKASLGSYKRFKDLELCKGDVIKIAYDVVPYIEFDESDVCCSRSGNEPIEAPSCCPECGSVLNVEDDENGEIAILRCDNKDCPSRIRGRILNYCQKMDIGNISYITISDFYNEGYLNSIEDLYSLKDHKDIIIKMDGYSEIRFDNIIDEIENHMVTDLPTLMGSIGIEGISKKKFESIFDYITLDELLKFATDGNIEIFTVIPGIKEKTAQKLMDGINANIDLIKYLRKNLIINEPVSHSGEFTVCFTKVREDDEPGLKEFIEEAGGIIDNDSFTKKTSILVIPYEGVVSSKINKAVKYDIPIVTIDKLKEYITDNFK